MATPTTTDGLSLALQAGVSADAYNKAVADPKNAGLNPDALIGNLLSTQPKSPVPSPTMSGVNENPPIVSPFAPAPAINPVQNTSAIRATEQGVRSDATSLLNNIGIDEAAYQSFDSTEAAKKQEAAVKAAEEAQKAAYAGQYTEAEQKKIEDAGKAMEAYYKPLLEEAQGAKASGLPKAIVGAGQQGGLMNTQYAGAAALLPTQGKTFVGAGGELERIASQYDRNISQVQTAMNSAINMAKENAKIAIQGGKEMDLKAAYKAYDTAKAKFSENQELVRQRTEAIQQAKAKQDNFQKVQRATADATLEEIVNSGVSVDELPADLFKNMDAQLGRVDGVTAGIFNLKKEEQLVRRQAAGFATQKQAIDQASSLNNVLSKTPIGQPVEIGDHVYYGTQGAGNIEVAEDGNAKMFTVDSETGNVRQVSLGYVGKKEDGWIAKEDDNGTLWRINPRTGQMLSLEPSVSDWQSVIPEGQTLLSNKFKYPDGKPMPYQCGEFVNAAAGITVGNTLREKISRTDKSITKDNVEFGDVIVSSEGGTSGHVSVINDIKYLNGQPKTYIVSEANYAGPGKVTHTRQVDVNDPHIKGYMRAKQLNPALLTGPDAPPRPGQQISRNVPGVEPGAKPTFGKKKPEVTKPLTPSEKLSLRKDIDSDKAVTNYRDLSTTFQKMKVSYDTATKSGKKSDKNATDQAMITLFNKMLDPTSVVREGEYDRVAQGQGLYDMAKSFIDQKTTGGAAITDATRKQMLDVASKFNDLATQAYNDRMDFYVPIIEEAGENPARYIQGYKPKADVTPIPGTTVVKREIIGPDGKRYNASQLSESELQEALSGGYKLSQ